MQSIAINYMGGDEILTNPLYLKWSQFTIENIKSALATLQADLGGIQASMDNLNIIAYLSTLVRSASLV